MIEIGVRMIEKQDETLSELREFREESKMNQELVIEKLDTISQKQDAMLEKQDETISELEGMRKDLRTILEERLAKLERDVMIKERLGIV